MFKKYDNNTHVCWLDKDIINNYRQFKALYQKELESTMGLVMEIIESMVDHDTLHIEISGIKDEVLSLVKHQISIDMQRDKQNKGTCKIDTSVNKPSILVAGKFYGKEELEVLIGQQKSQLKELEGCLDNLRRLDGLY